MTIINVQSLPLPAVTSGRQIARLEDYSNSLIDTKRGEAHLKTGIPPALFTLDIFDFFHKPGDYFVYSM